MAEGVHPSRFAGRGEGPTTVDLRDHVEVEVFGVDARVEDGDVGVHPLVVFLVDVEHRVGSGEDPVDSRRDGLGGDAAADVVLDGEDRAILPQRFDGTLGKLGRITVEGVAVDEAELPVLLPGLGASALSGVLDGVLEDNDVAAAILVTWSLRSRDGRAEDRAEAQNRQRDDEALKWHRKTGAKPCLRHEHSFSP
ncbi:MAG: hypothetical protein WA862_06765 [Solirubrobacterales bacterium]